MYFDVIVLHLINPQRRRYSLQISRHFLDYKYLKPVSTLLDNEASFLTMKYLSSASLIRIFVFLRKQVFQSLRRHFLSPLDHYFLTRFDCLSHQKIIGGKLHYHFLLVLKYLLFFLSKARYLKLIFPLN